MSVMTFHVLSDAERDWADEELFPRPGDRRGTIALAPEDGPTHSFRVTGARVTDVTHGRARVVADLAETPARLYITRTRVAVAAWSGGGPLVGHVRYGWVTGVHARDRAAVLTPATLVVGFRDPHGAGDGSLVVTLSGRTSATRTASAIAALAARHQAAGASGALRARLELWAAAPTAGHSGRYVRFDLPHD